MRVLLISHGRAAGAVLHDLRHRPPSEAAPAQGPGAYLFLVVAVLCFCG